MNDSFLKGKIIATISQTDLSHSQRIATEAGQRFDITSIVAPTKFSGGEFNPTHVLLKDLRRRGYQFDPAHAYAGLTVYIIKTAGPFKEPEEMVSRVGKTAYSFKYEYGAEKIVVVATDLDNGRAERGPNEDETQIGYMNAVKQMAHTWKANGVDQVITMHVHNPKIMDIFQEEFGNPEYEALINVSPVYLYADYLMRFSRLYMDGKLDDGGKDVVFLALDKGSYPMVKELSDIMALPNSRLVRFKKARAVPNDANRLHVELEEPYEAGILEDKDIVTLDDIIDTGGTRIKVNQWIEQDYEQKHLGKPRAYHDIFTHAVLAGQSFMDTQRRISQEMPKLREIIMSNTRPYIDDHVDYHKFKTMTTIIRTAKTYGDIIKSGLLNSASIHERHKDLYKQGMLRKNIYDIKRSSSFDSSIESVPEGFIRQLRVGWERK